MNNKTVIAVLVVLGILGLMLWGRNGQASLPDQDQAGASALTATETFYDFGDISMKDGNVEKIFEIANPTGKDITLASLTTSCMCTNAFIVKGGTRRGPFGMPGHGGPVPRANEIIRAGEMLGIAVVYDPNAHGPAGVGPVDRFVYLVDDEGGKFELEIKANVTP